MDRDKGVKVTWEGCGSMLDSRFADFFERKLRADRSQMAVRRAEVLQEHAEWVIERALVNQARDEIWPICERKTTATELPFDLLKQVSAELDCQTDQRNFVTAIIETFRSGNTATESIDA